MNVLLKMKRIKDLSPSERQVVNFILEDPARAAGMGITDLARESFTSTGTVMRVTRRLELDGFSSFRHQLASDLNEYLETTALFRPQEPIEPSDTLSDIVDKVTSNNVRAVLDVRSFNSLDMFRQVVDMMMAAKQLDFYGSGVSNLICHDAAMKALRLGLPSTAYTYYSEQAMLARTSPKDHLAVILSYTGQTDEILRVAQYLKSGGVPSVSITSHTDNALLELCSVNLFVDSFESVYRIGGMSSRLSSLHLLDILFSAYINRNYDKIKDSVDKTFLPETFRRLGENLDR